MNKNLVIPLGVLCVALGAKAEDIGYTPRQEDVVMLDMLPLPGAHQAYARCINTECYIMETGELIGEGPDGVYLVQVIHTVTENLNHHPEQHF